MCWTNRGLRPARRTPGTSCDEPDERTLQGYGRPTARATPAPGDERTVVCGRFAHRSLRMVVEPSRGSADVRSTPGVVRGGRRRGRRGSGPLPGRRPRAGSGAVRRPGDLGDRARPRRPPGDHPAVRAGAVHLHVGLASGPAFFGGLRQDGLRVGVAVVVLLAAIGLAVAGVSALFDFDDGARAGLFAGSQTNTPALSAALEQLAPEIPAARSPTRSSATRSPTRSACCR